MDGSEQDRDEQARRAEERLRPFLLAIALAMVAVYMLLVSGPQVGGISSVLKVVMLSALGLGCGVISYLFLGRGGGSAGARPASRIDRLELLPTRKDFLASLDAALIASRESGRQLALHIVDIDGFSLVNQLAGEAAGTALLGEAAKELTGVAGDASLLARIGDDEFALLQPACAGARDAELHARKIHDAMHQAAETAPGDARPAASIGVAVAPGHGGDAEGLLRSAGLALADAKKRGDTIRLYAREMEMAIESRRQMRRAVAKSLDEGWFELHYQPQYDLETRRLTGFEALVRMDHPEIGFQMPSAFLPIIEESGLLDRLGRWIVETAIATAADWPPDLSLSINISNAQMREGDLAATILAALAKARLDASRLRLDVSESLFVAPSTAVLEQCRRLKETGVRLVIEDFGLASSSLQTIARAQCDAMKIDRSLMQHVGEDTEADSLVRSLIRAAQSFGLEVHAEGVERAEQALFLVSNDCRRVQGYLFGRPVPAADLAAIIARDFRNSLNNKRGRDEAVA